MCSTARDRAEALALSASRPNSLAAVHCWASLRAGAKWLRGLPTVAWAAWRGRVDQHGAAAAVPELVAAHATDVRTALREMAAGDDPAYRFDREGGNDLDHLRNHDKRRTDEGANCPIYVRANRCPGLLRRGAVCDSQYCRSGGRIGPR